MFNFEGGVGGGSDILFWDGASYYHYGLSFLWRNMEDHGLGTHTDCKNTDKASNNTSRDYVDYKMIRWNKSAAENLFDDLDQNT